MTYYENDNFIHQAFCSNCNAEIDVMSLFSTLDPDDLQFCNECENQMIHDHMVERMYTAHDEELESHWNDTDGWTYDSLAKGELPMSKDEIEAFAMWLRCIF